MDRQLNIVTERFRYIFIAELFFIFCEVDNVQFNGVVQFSVRLL